MSRPIPIEDMVAVFKRNHKPCHLFKIDNFSLLFKYEIECVESSVFDLGCHKWKLYMYPNGNTECSRGHVSIFFENQTSIGVNLHFRVFVISQWKAERYPDVTHDFCMASKPTKRGYSKLMSHADLKAKGFLIEDCVMFGVKLIGVEPAAHGTAECFSLIEKPPKNNFTWTTGKFSSFEHCKAHTSNDFVFGNRKWCLQVHPHVDFGHGCRKIKGHKGPEASFSLNLLPKEFIKNVPKSKTFVIYKLRVLDQCNRNHVEKTGCDLLEPEPGHKTGCDNIMHVEKLGEPYFVNDKLHVGVEFEVISVTNYC